MQLLCCHGWLPGCCYIVIVATMLFSACHCVVAVVSLGGCQGVAIKLLLLLFIFSLLSCRCCGFFEWFPIPGCCYKVTVATFLCAFMQLLGCCGLLPGRCLLVVFSVLLCGY